MNDIYKTKTKTGTRFTPFNYNEIIKSKDEIYSNLVFPLNQKEKDNNDDLFDFRKPKNTETKNQENINEKEPSETELRQELKSLKNNIFDFNNDTNNQLRIAQIEQTLKNKQLSQDRYQEINYGVELINNILNESFSLFIFLIKLSFLLGVVLSFKVFIEHKTLKSIDSQPITQEQQKQVEQKTENILDLQEMEIKNWGERVNQVFKELNNQIEIENLIEKSISIQAPGSKVNPKDVHYLTEQLINAKKSINTENELQNDIDTQINNLKQLSK